MGLAIACGDSSTRSEVGTGGSGGSAGGGAAGGANLQGGFGGTPPRPTGGSAPDQGGETGQGGVPDQGGETGQGGVPGGAEGGGGAPVGGAGGASAEGGADGSGGSGEQCDTTPLTGPHVAACAVAPTVTQEYQVGLATEQLSFGVRLRATGYFDSIVHMNEVEVHYYYSQEETSGFQPSVDSFILQPSGLDLTSSSEISIVALDPKQSSTSGPGCQTHFIRIRNTNTALLPVATQGEPYAELHVTLTPNNPAPPNQNHADDHSYVPEATNWDQTSLLGVYHCGGLTSGCTPGDGGTCN